MNCEFEVKEGNSPRIPKNYVDTLTVCRCVRLCGPQVHCNLRMRFLLFCLDTSIYRLNLFFFCCQLLKLRFIPLLDLLFCWVLGTRCICWSSRRTKRGPDLNVATWKSTGAASISSTQSTMIFIFSSLGTLLDLISGLKVWNYTPNQCGRHNSNHQGGNLKVSQVRRRGR